MTRLTKTSTRALLARRVFGSAVAVLGLATAIAIPAGAQTRGPDAGPGFRWTGLQLGGHFGYADADADWSFVKASGRVVDRDPIKGTAMGVEQNPSGLFGGVHVGASWQIWRIVLGADVSYSPTRLKDERGSPVPGGDDINSTRIGNLLRTTGRIGYAWDRYHAYVNAGWADARVDTAFVDAVGPRRSQGSASFSTMHKGWTVGGGLDYRLSEHWVAGLEYAYVDLEEQLHDKFVPTGSVNTGRAVDAVAPGIHMVSARLSVLLTPPGR